MIQRSPVSSRPFCPAGWCKTDLMTALHTLHSISEQESEQLIWWADKGLGGACSLTWWTTFLATLLIALTHWLRFADFSTTEMRESSEFKARLFPLLTWKTYGSRFILFWSVSATLTVIKRLCPHTPTRCSDKHTIHIEQMNRLLDMHRSSNHYLASS